jgi:nitroreductase
MATPAWQGFFGSAQLSRWNGAIPTRFACRAFKEPANLSQFSALEYIAAQCCLPGVRIALGRKNADKLLVTPPLFPKFDTAKQFAVVLFDPEVDMSRLHAGMSGEALTLEIAALELASCWVAGVIRRPLHKAFARENEKIAAVIPLGVPVDPEGARLRNRKPLNAFCPDDPALWPLWAYQAGEAMRAAPSAMNRQPWHIGYAGQSLQFGAKQMNSLDAGIALLHLECALHKMPRQWRYVDSKKSAIVQVEGGDDPV